MCYPFFLFKIRFGAFFVLNGLLVALFYFLLTLIETVIDLCRGKLHHKRIAANSRHWQPFSISS